MSAIVGTKALRSATVGLYVALLVAGFVAKGTRYLAEVPAADGQPNDRILRVMQAHGWSLASVKHFPAGMPLLAMRFVKPQCTHEATITDLGDKAELEPYLRLLYRDHVSFLVNGRIATEPAASLRFGGLSRAIRRLKGASQPLLPILAMAPPPDGGHCTVPEESAWQ